MDDQDQKKLPISQLELDLLLLYYNFSDQHGVVDIQGAKTWAFKKLGIMLDNEPIILTQEHIDLLMDAKIVPDTRVMIAKVIKPRKASDSK